MSGKVNHALGCGSRVFQFIRLAPDHPLRGGLILDEIQGFDFFFFFFFLKKKLIEKFYHPNSGTISLDDVPLESLDSR